MLTSLLSAALVSSYRCQQAREKQTQERKKERKIRGGKKTKRKQRHIDKNRY